MKKSLIVVLFMVVSSTAFAQNNGPSLEQKWSRMLEKAENYDPYKVIKKTELADFWKSVNDSIVRYQKELKTERRTVASQQAEISQLKNTSAELNTTLSQTQIDKDSVTFLGIKANKFLYLSTLCLLFLVAVAGIVVLYYMYMNSNSVTTQKISAYAVLSKEFDEYKLGKIEMERKLRRELQTQVNKLEELKKGNG
jgi:hypothetical protein